MQTIRSTLLCVVFVGLLCPTAIGGQVCAGNPSADREVFGQLDVVGDYGFRSFGILAGVNAAGPTSVELKYELLDYTGVESQGNGLSGRVLYELRRPELSVCPFFGVRSSNLEYDYIRMDSVETYSARSLRIPFGVDIGKSIYLGSHYVIAPSADVRYVFRVLHVLDTADGRSTFTDEELYVTIRAAVFIGKLYNGFEVGGSTERSNKTFGFFVGVAF